jgi:hypothetical protein
MLTLPASRSRVSLISIRGCRQSAVHGNPLAHKPERSPAHLAPVLRLEHPLGGDDVAGMHNRLVPAGGTVSRREAK